ncbi:MAG: hypothetical protein ACQKBW_04575 [Puniceicoccales bacterium]
MLFNIASRDHPLPSGWLADSLFDLSAKKMSVAQIRNLKYSLSDEDVRKTTDSSTYYLVDGEIRFIAPEDTTAQPSPANQSQANDAEK